jgi:hypothetical protein
MLTKNNASSLMIFSILIYFMFLSSCGVEENLAIKKEDKTESAPLASQWPEGMKDWTSKDHVLMKTVVDDIGKLKFWRPLVLSESLVNHKEKETIEDGGIPLPSSKKGFKTNFKIKGYTVGSISEVHGRVVGCHNGLGNRKFVTHILPSGQKFEYNPGACRADRDYLLFRISEAKKLCGKFVTPELREMLDEDTNNFERVLGEAENVFNGWVEDSKGYSYRVNYDKFYMDHIFRTDEGGEMRVRKHMLSVELVRSGPKNGDDKTTKKIYTHKIEVASSIDVGDMVVCDVPFDAPVPKNGDLDPKILSKVLD